MEYAQALVAITHEDDDGSHIIKSTRALKLEERWLPFLKKAKEKYVPIVPSNSLRPHTKAEGFNLLGQLLFDISNSIILGFVTEDTGDMLEAYKDLGQMFGFNVP
ncbi:hypothetical protein CFOL_v3_20605 [Cephalotus follicularis]|uniref:Uncharacterized protein n=1 Tax=Cephalotus follicularis TaxID=3775 RepID=A0A1Q3CAM1_CEPFO|nr:hypothetical protein CFOL_v3_20605 [Cephalotus follicularis]